MHFVDIGRTPDTTYLIMPCLRKGMDMKKIGGVELKKKFLLIYHYLRPIVQLQSVKIAHLSITPRNYLNRPGTPHLVLTDLGLARRYGYRRKEVVGTPAYLSVPAHYCEPVSMVDDMQSWFIICTELLEYPLPWSDIVDNGEEGYKKTLDIKQRYLTMMSQSPNFGEFLTELRNEIWDKGAKDTIDMVRVSTLIEDLQMQYQFRLTEAWE